MRGKVAGTAERPRLAVFRSNRGIYAQLVDDSSGKTLAAASWLALKGFKGDKTEQAAEVGKLARREREEGRDRDASCSTAAATCTTDASRRSPTARAREG